MTKENALKLITKKIEKTKGNIEDLKQKIILEQRAAEKPKLEKELEFETGQLYGLSYAKTLINHKIKDLIDSGFLKAGE